MTFTDKNEVLTSDDDNVGVDGELGVSTALHLDNWSLDCTKAVHQVQNLALQLGLRTRHLNAIQSNDRCEENTSTQFQAAAGVHCVMISDW
jgi:hypothetical protein